MSFELINAFVTFQAHINKILTKKLNVCCIVYLNDIIIYSENSAKPTENVRWILQKLRENDLFANINKCRFSIKKCKFLNYIVSADEINMQENRIEVIRTWPKLKCVRDIQVFIEFANFYRKFIKKFNKKIDFLIFMIKNTNQRKFRKIKREISSNERFFIDKTLKAFNIIKKTFLNVFLLRHFDYSLSFKIEINAFDAAINKVLTQFFENRWHSCAYFFKKMHSAKRNYETHDVELFAIMKTFKHRRYYLIDFKQKILMFTDHHNLQTFMKTIKFFEK